MIDQFILRLFECVIRLVTEANLLCNRSEFESAAWIRQASGATYVVGGTAVRQDRTTPPRELSSGNTVHQFPLPAYLA